MMWVVQVAEAGMGKKGETGLGRVGSGRDDLLAKALANDVEIPRN